MIEIKEEGLRVQATDDNIVMVFKPNKSSDRKNLICELRELGSLRNRLSLMYAAVLITVDGNVVKDKLTNTELTHELILYPTHWSSKPLVSLLNDTNLKEWASLKEKHSFEYDGGESQMLNERL